SFYDYMKVHPDAAFKIVALTDKASLVSIPMRKGKETESLIAEINKAIAELSESGELSEISKKYFASDITQK
ncbi:MAG: transporter substrate-binding domain-containing protein, partial [Treponema sp.]|nr:transporter substrate-binding domain-containing protein [Treponema sp.]